MMVQEFSLAREADRFQLRRGGIADKTDGEAGPADSGQQTVAQAWMRCKLVAQTQTQHLYSFTPHIVIGVEIMVAKRASASVPLLAATDSCSCWNDNGPVASSDFTAIHLTVYGDRTSAKKLSMFGSLCVVIYS